MSNVRVYMRASWTSSNPSESRDVTVREYEDACFVTYGSVEGRELHVLRGEDVVAIFPQGNWVGVELY